MSYQLKCQNSYLVSDGQGGCVARICGKVARDCECDGGFQPSQSSQVPVSRDMSVCLCGNIVPDGYPVERKHVGGLDDGEVGSRGMGWAKWQHPGQCQQCVKVERLNTKSAARSIELSQSLAIMGNPWQDVAHGVNRAVVAIVTGFRRMGLWDCGWNWFPPVKEPAVKNPTTITYRVGLDRPNLPSIEEIEPADCVRVSGDYSRRVSRPIHNG